MAWQVAQQGDKYRIWTTLSDACITEWCTRQEVLAFIAEQYLQEYKEKVVEMYLMFPHYWPAREGGRRLIQDEEAKERYLEWLRTLSDAGDTYDAVLEKKYGEVMAELNRSQDVRGKT